MHAQNDKPLVLSFVAATENPETALDNTQRNGEVFQSFFKDSCITNGAASFGKQGVESFIYQDNLANDSRVENWAQNQSVSQPPNIFLDQTITSEQ